MTCISMHMCVGLPVLSDTLGLMLSLGWRHELDSAETGSELVEAGCCDTSQHRWQSLNEDWAFTADS